MIGSFLLLFSLLKQEDKISRYIYAISVWTLICFSMTEILSFFNAINTRNLWICWLILDVALIVLNLVRYKKTGLKDKTIFLRKRNIEWGFIAWGIFAIAMLLLAVKTVPYNWDSMTYHLPRLFHWAQNASVEYYATADSRQVASPIMGAYVNLHVYVMTGNSDRFLNLLQCCSFLTNSILVFNIAKKIGCSKRYCYMAMLLFCSMPIAFAEALTTQVDNFSALWMLSTVYLLLDLLRYENKLKWDKETFGRIIVLSLCVAFGYLTKPSVGIGLLVFAIWLLIVVIKRKDRLLSIAAYLITAVFILAALLMPGLCRNIATFHALSAPEVGQRQLIGTLNPKEVLVNCVKNVTFNMPAIWIYDSSSILYNGVTEFAELLDVDIDDPAISEDGRNFKVHEVRQYSHDAAINPVIVWFFMGSIVLWIVKNRKKGFSEIRNAYFIISGISFVLFCAVLRWEPFVSRYMISYLAILCPAIMGQLEIFFIEKENIRQEKIESGAVWLIYFLCITELFGLTVFHGKIALTESRVSGYFMYCEEIENLYREATDVINSKNYEEIGMIIGDDPYEYPLTVMLENYSRLEHVNVMNATGVYEDFEFIPDAIISINYSLTGNEMDCHGERYKLTEVIEVSDGNVSILEKCMRK